MYKSNLNEFCTFFVLTFMQTQKAVSFHAFQAIGQDSNLKDYVEMNSTFGFVTSIDN